MNDEDRRRAAQAILEFPFFLDLWNEIEQAAISACINADYTDHEKRQAHAAEARAIRRVRDRLTSMAKQPDAPRKAPA
ncbi:MAG: hypothetical protein ACTHKQ_05655 [Mesorhizobium sp.]